MSRAGRVVGPAEEAVSDVLRGKTAAIARMLSRVERGSAGADADAAALYRYGGNAHIIGVTGAPGAGKSTLVGRLGAQFNRRGRKVAILAIDPSSPYTGGAILGDRIRMQDLTEGCDVFIRSMATRGSIGGLARAAVDAISVLDAARFDVIIVETVGAGQDEVAVADAAQTTLVVSVPGLGDDIQAIKAGILEIADLHVVNKADLTGADRVIAQLRDVLRFGPMVPPQGWRIPVLGVSALKGEGLEGLAEKLDEHLNWLTKSGELAVRNRRMAERWIRTVATEMLQENMSNPTLGPSLGELVDEVTSRQLDPRAAAERLVGAGR